MKNWKFRTGIFLLILSFSTTPMIVLTPFLHLNTKTKVIITTLLIIIGNITFYSGGFLVGKEIFTKYKQQLNPNNWFKNKAMVSNILDITRIMLVSVAFYFGYKIGFAHGYDPIAQLHFMTPVIIVAIAGLSGLEGLLFGKSAAKAKGFDSGGNYQRQSAIALLSYAVIAVLIYFAEWGIYAELTILFAFIFFFFFSAINHGIEAVRHKNYKWQNLNRPVITLLMIAGLAYPVIMALKSMN